MEVLFLMSFVFYFFRLQAVLKRPFWRTPTLLSFIVFVEMLGLLRERLRRLFMYAQFWLDCCSSIIPFFLSYHFTLYISYYKIYFFYAALILKEQNITYTAVWASLRFEKDW